MEQFEEGNEGYIGSVTMNDTNEVIDGWLKGNKAGEADPSVFQAQTARQVSTGFALNIENTGWDCQWSEITGYPANRINPWSIQAKMENISIAHREYVVSFKASATKKKYCYVSFSGEYPEADISGDKVIGDANQIIVLEPTERTFIYRFTNCAEVKKLSITLQLGSFYAQYDFDGNDVSDIITEKEYGWKGTVYVSDIKIEEGGLCLSCFGILPQETTENGEMETTLSEENQTETTTINIDKPVETTTTQKETLTNKVELAKSKVKKATKSKKLKKVKISLKNIKGASGYQIQISKKKNFENILVKKKMKKKSFSISSKKIKKIKKIYVRARAFVKKNGKTYYGDWSNAKKVKIK